MNHKLFFAIATLFAVHLLPHSVFAEPVVTDVVAQQRYPWNGKVDITCIVSGLEDATSVVGWMFAVSIILPESGESSPVQQVKMIRDGAGIDSLNVEANGAYHLLWDAHADLGEVFYSNMVVRVEVVEPKVQLWEGGPYWAEMNIGAEKPEDYGLYFWWGDTIGYRREGGSWVASDGSSQNFSFSTGNTPTSGMSISALQSQGWVVQKEYVLAPEHDAAHVHWGGSWRMPTYSEFYALNNNCDWTWTTQNGVKGYIVRGRGAFAANSIFLPAAGYGYGSSLRSAGSYGGSWSSVPNEDDSEDAGGLGFLSGNRGARWVGRYCGLPVRPVQGFAE